MAAPVKTRTRGEILGEMRAIASLMADTRRQLEEVQRHEWRLVTALDGHRRRMERLVDELSDYGKETA